MSNENEFARGLYDLASRFSRDVHANREKILRAFIAETGCLPSECEQVTQYTPEGLRWFVRRRGDGVRDA